MSKEKHNQNLMLGAAVVAGILGTLSALMRSNKSVQSWAEQARDVANNVLEKGETVNKNMLLGGVAGGIIGAVTALLFAPKAGTDLIKDIAHCVSHPSELIHSASRKAATKKSSARRKGASAKSHVAKHKGAAKTEEGKARRSVDKRKTHPRRRTAASVLKHHATTAVEKASEAAAT